MATARLRSASSRPSSTILPEKKAFPTISAGLDYPGVGPEHAYLRDTGRAEYVPITDEEAVNAFEYLSRMEGIIPAIESAHAVAYAMKIAPEMDENDIIMVCLSGRGDKDVRSIAEYRRVDLGE